MFVREDDRTYEINVNTPIGFGTRSEYGGRDVPKETLGPFMVVYFQDYLEVQYLNTGELKRIPYADRCPESDDRADSKWASCWLWCETAVLQYAVYAFPV